MEHQHHGEWLDNGKKAKTSATDTAMATMEALNRGENAQGKAVSSQNAYKHGMRRLVKQSHELLKAHNAFLVQLEITFIHYEIMRN